MKSKKLIDNDLYLFLKKDNFNIEHIIDYIASVENLHEKDKKMVLDKATIVVNESLFKEKNNYYDLERMQADCMALAYMKYFPIYDLLLAVDKERASLVWEPKTIALIDQYWTGQKIIEKYEPNFLKKKAYRDSGIITTHDTLIYWNNKLLVQGVEKYEDFLHYTGTQLNRYGNSIHWKNALKDQPLLSIAIHAAHSGYTLTEHELFHIFKNLGQYIYQQSLENVSNKDIFDYVLESYCQLLLESKFFQHTLVPQNNVRSGLKKFLIQDKVLENGKFSKTFFNEVLNYKEFSYVNMNYKVDKKLQLKLMGKYCLKPEEITLFQEKLKNMVKPSISKKKI